MSGLKSLWFFVGLLAVLCAFSLIAKKEVEKGPQYVCLTKGEYSRVKRLVDDICKASGGCFEVP